MAITKLTTSSSLYPESLKRLSDPPRQLFYSGDIEAIFAAPKLAIVGSRKVSPYGRQVTEKLAREAAEQGIAIISGLALGIDGIAHQAALDSKGLTLAVLPGGLDKIYPASHHHLAERIFKSGGAFISEYPVGTQPFKTNFVARNRIVAGIADAVLITEAAVKSGSIHTANFALEQGKTVLAVPGNITSDLSKGTNNLIKAGAIPVTELRDILAAMGLERMQKKAEVLGDTEEQTIILAHLSRGVSDAAELMHLSALDPQLFNQSLSLLEINGKVRALGAGHWGLA